MKSTPSQTNQSCGCFKRRTVISSLALTMAAAILSPFRKLLAQTPMPQEKESTETKVMGMGSHLLQGKHPEVKRVPDDYSTNENTGGGISTSGSIRAPRKWNNVCVGDSNQPTTVGGWMRRTSGLRANGCIYTGLSTPPVRRSTSFCRLNAT